MTLNCRFICDLMNVVFYDGKRESAEEVCKTFGSEFFEWRKWEPFSPNPPEYALYYHCDDYPDDIVPTNVYIFQMNFGHTIHTEWLTEDEFKKYFEIIK